MKETPKKRDDNINYYIKKFDIFFKHTYSFQVFHYDNIITFISKENYFLENNQGYHKVQLNHNLKESQPDIMVSFSLQELLLDSLEGNITRWVSIM